MGPLKAVFALGFLLAMAAFIAPATGRAEAESETKCVSSDEEFKSTAGRFWFEVALKNTCDKRLSCKVNASVLDVKGVHLGSKTLSLAPGSKNRPANAAYRMKVGAAGGTGSVSFRCRST